MKKLLANIINYFFLLVIFVIAGASSVYACNCQAGGSVCPAGQYDATPANKCVPNAGAGNTGVLCCPINDSSDQTCASDGGTCQNPGTSCPNGQVSTCTNSRPCCKNAASGGGGGGGGTPIYPDSTDQTCAADGGTCLAAGSACTNRVSTCSNSRPCCSSTPISPVSGGGGGGGNTPTYPDQTDSYCASAPFNGTCQAAGSSCTNQVSTCSNNRPCCTGSASNPVSPGGTITASSCVAAGGACGNTLSGGGCVGSVNGSLVNGTSLGTCSDAGNTLCCKYNSTPGTGGGGTPPNSCGSGTCSLAHGNNLCPNGQQSSTTCDISTPSGFVSGLCCNMQQPTVTPPGNNPTVPPANPNQCGYDVCNPALQKCVPNDWAPGQQMCVDKSSTGTSTCQSPSFVCGDDKICCANGEACGLVYHDSSGTTSGYCKNGSNSPVNSGIPVGQPCNPNNPASVCTTGSTCTRTSNLASGPLYTCQATVPLGGNCANNPNCVTGSSCVPVSGAGATQKQCQANLPNATIVPIGGNCANNPNCVSGSTCVPVTSGGTTQKLCQANLPNANPVSVGGNCANNPNCVNGSSCVSVTSGTGPAQKICQANLLNGGTAVASNPCDQANSKALCGTGLSPQYPIDTGLSCKVKEGYGCYVGVLNP